MLHLHDSADFRPPTAAHPQPPPSLPPISTPSRECQLLASLLSGFLDPLHALETAQALLDNFGTAAAVLSASPHRLRSVPGLDRAGLIAIKTAEALSILHAEAGLPDQLNPLLDNYDRVIQFCRSRLGHKPREEFHILFVNKRQRLIRAETHQHGTIDHTPAYPREVCRRAIELDASSLILCHNHPSGDPTPSRADIEMTKRIAAATATLGISVLDHIIVAGPNALSFKAKGHL